jgi:hypothetical protein
MKTKSILLFAALASTVVAATDELPKSPSFARYEPMMNKSLFAVATANVAPPVTPNAFKDLYICNCARLSDESVVTLCSSTDKNLKEYLSTRAPNKSGYSIQNIEWSEKVGQTKVTITKDGQFATLTFNQALISTPVANAPIPPQPVATPLPTTLTTQPAGTVPPVPQYNQPATNTNTIKPAPSPSLPTPPPRVRGVIQRNPAQATDSVPQTDN